MLPDVCSSSSAIPGFRGWRPVHDVAIEVKQVFGDKLRVEFLETPLLSAAVYSRYTYTYTKQQRILYILGTGLHRHNQ